MKFSTLICSVAFISSTVFAEDIVPVTVAIKDVRVYQPENYSLSRGAIIANRLNQYHLTLTKSKPVGTKAPETRLTLSAGQFGFSPLVNFMHCTINDIPIKKLLLQSGDLTEWSQGEKKGAQFKFNYDGAKFILLFWMRPDSPVLWGSLIADPNTLEAAQKIEIKFVAIPSALAKNSKKQVVFDGHADEYARRAVTSVRTIEQGKKAIPLTAEDGFVILQDAKFDGSASDKGVGPCLVILDDFASVSKANLLLRNSWVAEILLTLKPETKVFSFGLWQRNPVISNADFAKKFAAEKAAFTR